MKHLILLLLCLPPLVTTVSAAPLALLGYDMQQVRDILLATYQSMLLPSLVIYLIGGVASVLMVQWAQIRYEHILAENACLESLAGADDECESVDDIDYN